MKNRPPLNLPERTILLDGGMGRELRFRGIETPATIWSTHALLVAPEVVRDIHMDYIAAGADIITANTYGIIRSDLAKEGIEDRFEALNKLACTLALEARDTADHPVWIAGSLPPLKGSFRPDLVGDYNEIERRYREQAEILAPHVDLLLCETMSTSTESRAAASAVCQTGKPVWVAWTLHEDRSGRLRSGESIADAAAVLANLPVDAYLANCCAPESITAALPYLIETGAQYIGGYANTFELIPADWELAGEEESDWSLDLRSDLDPDSYAGHVIRWLDEGANVVGGCCGTRPEHIARMSELISKT
jgi:S-methylmethionine-dependent homocysteine/selenocysteine methylase